MTAKSDEGASQTRVPCSCGRFQVSPPAAWAEADKYGERWLHSARKCVDFNSLPEWGKEILLPDQPSKDSGPTLTSPIAASHPVSLGEKVWIGEVRTTAEALDAATLRPERAASRARVFEAAKVVIHWGEHCSEGYRGPCEHCEAMEELEAAVKALEPIDQFVNVPEKKP